MFDDLIPLPPQGFQRIPDDAAPASRTGMFDDLIAEAEAKRGAPEAETPPADADPQTWGEYIEGVTQKVAQGVTFNFGDEIAARAGSVGNTLARAAGMDIPVRDYQLILDEIRGREKRSKPRTPRRHSHPRSAGR